MSITELTGNPRHDQLVHYIAERGYMNIESSRNYWMFQPKLFVVIFAS
jgi:hypothetical protein